jgi:hypothetical protein
MQRVLHIAARILIGLASLIVLAALVLVIRLAVSPMSIGMVTPRLAEALSDLVSGYRIEIEDTYLFWNRDHSNIELSARDVSLVGADSAVVSVLPRVDAAFNVPVLLRGKLAPTEIHVLDARATLVRHPRGWDFRPDSPDSLPAEREAPATPDTEIASDRRHPFDRVLAALVAEPDPEQPLTYLRDVWFTASLDLHDQLLDVEWSAPQVEVRLRRAKQSVEGDVNVWVVVGTEHPRFAGELRFDPSLEVLSINGELTDLRLSKLSRLVPGLQAVSVSVKVSAEVDSLGTMRNADLQLSIGAGTASLPRLNDRPWPVRSGAAHLQVNRDRHTVDIDSLYLALGTTTKPGPRFTLRLNGRLTEADTLLFEALKQGPVEAEGSVTMDSLNIADLEQYWPTEVAVGARAWVLKHVKSGAVNRVRVPVALRDPPGDQPRTFELRDCHAAYNGLEIEIDETLPTLTGITGTVEFVPKTLDVTLTRGSWLGIEVADTRVSISALGTKQARADIATQIDGPIADVMTILTSPMVDVLPADLLEDHPVGGTAYADARFALPLRSPIDLTSITLDVIATVEEASVANIIQGHAAKNGTLSIAMTQHEVQFDGEMNVADIPLQVRLLQPLASNRRNRRWLRLASSSLTSTALAGLGIDAGDYLEGALEFDAQIEFVSKGAGTVDAILTLDDARLDVPQIRWQKERGVPGKAAFTVDLKNNRPVTVRDLRVDAGTLRLSGQIGFAADTSKPNQIALDRLHFGKTDLRAHVTIEPAGTSVTIENGQLDLSPFLAEEEPGSAAPADNNRSSGDEPPASTAPRPREHTPLSVSVALERVEFAPGRYVNDVSLQLEREARGWSHVELLASVPSSDGETAGAEPLTMRLGPLTDGAHPLTIRTNDIGSLLRATDVYDGVEGGRLHMNGERRGSDPSNPIDVHVDTRDVTLNEVSVAVRVLDVMSIRGLLTAPSDGRHVRHQRRRV